MATAIAEEATSTKQKKSDYKTKEQKAIPLIDTLKERLKSNKLLVINTKLTSLGQGESLSIKNSDKKRFKKITRTLTKWGFPDNALDFTHNGVVTVLGVALVDLDLPILRKEEKNGISTSANGNGVQKGDGVRKSSGGLATQLKERTAQLTFKQPEKSEQPEKQSPAPSPTKLPSFSSQFEEGKWISEQCNKRDIEHKFSAFVDKKYSDVFYIRVKKTDIEKLKLFLDQHYGGKYDLAREINRSPIRGVKIQYYTEASPAEESAGKKAVDSTSNVSETKREETKTSVSENESVVKEPRTQQPVETLTAKTSKEETAKPPKGTPNWKLLVGFIESLPSEQRMMILQKLQKGGLREQLEEFLDNLRDLGIGFYDTAEPLKVTGRGVEVSAYDTPFMKTIIRDFVEEGRKASRQKDDVAS